jgi:3-hydroxybutyryl-CoA dehydrogenase
VVFNSARGPVAGTYALVMWENLADPILAGRELQGIPKVFADIPDHTVADGAWHCSASHFGHRIVDLRVSQLRAPTPEEIAADAAAREGRDNPMGWRFLPGIGGFGTALSETTLFPSETVFAEVQVGEGAIDWNRLTWEQNPTQYHIVNALADLPVVEYRPAAVTRGSANLAVPGRMSRVLQAPGDDRETVTAAPERVREISKVCFVGAGTMGCFNALVAALSGYRAVLYDAQAEALARVPATQQEMAAFLVGSGYCLPADLPEAFERITTTGNLAEAVAGAGLVSESVFEDLELKRKIHAELDRLCEPATILTTNTSALLVSDIEDAVGRGERFAALHSHLGAPLVDIVGGPRTSAATIDLLERYVRSLRGIPMVLEKEHKGYAFNALMGPLLTTALMLVVEGLATHEEVDRAWMVNRKAPMGPFGMMDLFGLNVVYDSWRGEDPDSALGPVRAKILPYLAPRVERGDLGMKTTPCCWRSRVSPRRRQSTAPGWQQRHWTPGPSASWMPWASTPSWPCPPPRRARLRPPTWNACASFCRPAWSTRPWARKAARASIPTPIRLTGPATSCGGRPDEGPVYHRRQGGGRDRRFTRHRRHDRPRFRRGGCAYLHHLAQGGGTAGHRRRTGQTGRLLRAALRPGQRRGRDRLRWRPAEARARHRHPGQQCRGFLGRAAG